MELSWVFQPASYSLFFFHIAWLMVMKFLGPGLVPSSTSAPPPPWMAQLPLTLPLIVIG